MSQGSTSGPTDLSHLLRDARACVERIDVDGKVLLAVGAVEALRGVAPTLRRGQDFLSSVARADRARVQAALTRCEQSDSRVTIRYSGRRGGGVGRMVTTDFRREPGGTIVSTTRRWSPAEGHAAFVDAIQESIDRGDTRYAVVLVDLLEMHRVSSAFGYRRAQEIFEYVTRQIEGLLQPGDRIWPTARAQVGALLASGSPTRTEALVMDIERFFASPLEFEGNEIRLGARVGVSAARTRYVSSEQLLIDAEAAARRGAGAEDPEAKIFSTHFMDEDRRQLSLAGAMGPAIRNGELSLVFQPIIDLSTRTSHGFEVLSRWVHPQLGFVSPVEFIPLAEDLGVVGELDANVLERACAELVSWGLDGPIHLSANVSGRQADDPELLGRVLATLAKTGFPAESLRLEVTETAVVQSAERCRTVLAGLQASGISVAMDDFGTGYASFRQLVEMPIDILKIDRSFVDRVARDTRGRQIVKAVISMAHQLGMKVVAEGVEDREQLLILVEMGCDYAQGYFFAKPLPPEQAREWAGRAVTW